jgi:CheY-like chemotaxis protein
MQDRTGKRGYGGGGQREAVREVVAVARDQADAAALPSRHDAEAVVLDLVNPAGAGGRLLRGARQAGLKNGYRPIVVQSASRLTRHGHRCKRKGLRRQSRVALPR